MDQSKGISLRTKETRSAELGIVSKIIFSFRSLKISKNERTKLVVFNLIFVATLVNDFV